MTVETLVYAVGGGHGHAVRGLLIADRLLPSGESPGVVVRKGALDGVEGVPRHFPILEVEGPEEVCKLRGEHVVVDTFPRGWWGELQGVLDNAATRTFIARYRSDLSWEELQRDFTHIWLPYGPSTNEWDACPPSAELIGVLTKSEPCRIEHDGRTVVLYDPEHRCGEPFRRRAAELAALEGCAFQIIRRLPSCLAAYKFLAVGAGYNTFYELLANGPHVRFLPVSKRYDNQFRRVQKYERGISSFQEMQVWLREQ